MNDRQAEIKKLWSIVATDEKSVLEARGLPSKGGAIKLFPVVKHFRGADYPSLQDLRSAFEAAVLELNDAGYNLYTVMNPLRTDFQGPGAARDVDVLYRDLLLVDIDRMGDTSSPASQEELDAAKALAIQVRTYLTGQGWPSPITVMSGNGYHLYYVLGDLPNDRESELLVKRVLHTLASQFNNELVGIDTSVYNAARITKIPGTVMRKGVETPERPYRIAYVCDE